MTERIRALRNAFLAATRAVDTERAVLITESYRANEDQSEAMKRALSMRHLLENMTIEIRPNELIVGCYAPKLRATPMFPDYGTGWILAQMDDLPTRGNDQFAITEEQKQTLRECCAYWKGFSLDCRVRAAVPPELQKILDYNVAYNTIFHCQSPGHIVAGYKYLLKTGYETIIENCQKKLEALQIDDDQYLNQRDLYQSCIVTLQGAIAYARRFAVLAHEMAAQEQNPIRRSELERIAANCERVPAKPARDYWEALQFVYLIQMTIRLEGNALGVSLGRLDQYLYPYYKADRDAGRINYDGALELMECFYLKLSEIDKVASNESAAALAGPAHGQTITIGGVDAQGNDATNDLSIMVLEADRAVSLDQPDIAVRLHRNTSQRLIDAATVNVKIGLNKVKVCNDEIVQEALRRCGVDAGECYNFSYLGCSEPVIEGHTNSWGNCGHVNLAKCLELALNDGKCMLTGAQMGPHTGDAAQFTTFEQVRKAYEAQVQYFTDALVKYDRIIDLCHQRYLPLPFCSVIIEDCIERGIAFEMGGAKYNFTSPLAVAPITVGDSLEAIKTLVYEQGKVTMPELLYALKTDFADNEKLRLMLKNRAPKYGNDLDEPDAMSSYAISVFCDALEGRKNARGGIFTAGVYYLTANVPNGERTAASANGRHAYTPLNDGGISATHGDDRNGATALLKSAGKLCNVRAGHGSVLNQLLHPTIFAGEDGEKLFGAYLRSVVDCRVWEAQFNVITREDLLDAQVHPENYRSLVVRVAGYSAFFTGLSKNTQDDIISRTSLTQY